MDEQRIIYYTDELRDEFSTFTTTPPVIDGSYDYDDSSFLKQLRRFFVYRIMIIPIAWLHSQIAFHRKTVGREKLRPYRKQGIFLYGNHTQPVGDAFLQACLTYPRTNYVVVHPNNLMVPFFGRLIPALGALPLPDTIPAFKNFKEAIAKRIRKGHPVVIYPEAHIWPWYTGIRPFADTSFAYPVQLNAPVFCFTNTYQKRRFGRKPRMVTYIDGPFFPDPNLSPREQKKQLRDTVYEHMVQSARNSNVEMIKYVRKAEENKAEDKKEEEDG